MQIHVNPKPLLSPLSSLLMMTFWVGGLIVGCSAQTNPVKAPNFTLTDVAGKKFSLSQFQGKIVFLEFWATWCPPCVMSMPDVQKLDQEYKSKDLEVISLSLDENPDALMAFLSNHQLKNRVALATPQVQSQYGVDGIPAFFIIDKNGYVTRSWGGFHPSLPNIWRKEIDRLLKA